MSDMTLSTLYICDVVTAEEVRHVSVVSSHLRNTHNRDGLVSEPIHRPIINTH